MNILNRTLIAFMITLVISPVALARDIRFINDINYGEQWDRNTSSVNISIKVNSGQWIELGNSTLDRPSLNVDLKEGDIITVKVKGTSGTYTTKPFSIPKSQHLSLISIEGRNNVEKLVLGNDIERFYDKQGRGRWGITCYGLTVGLGGFVCDIKSSKYQLSAVSAGLMPVVGAGTASIDMNWVENNVGRDVEGQSVGALFYSKITANADGKRVFNGDIGGVAVGVNKFTGSFEVK